MDWSQQAHIDKNRRVAASQPETDARRTTTIRIAPTCTALALGPFLAGIDAYQNQRDFTPSRIGIAYMLAGDSPSGGASNIEPYAEGPTPENDWVVEGPHVMIIVLDDSILEGLPIVPGTDGPYVMYADTPLRSHHAAGG